MQEVFEQIIEKLEEELKLADKEKERCIKENHLQFDSAKGYANGVAIAIEIVKQEAEQYNKGFCEWHLYDEESCTYETDCRNMHIFIDGSPSENNYLYCPYCGKMIKPYQPKGE